MTKVYNFAVLVNKRSDFSVWKRYIHPTARLSKSGKKFTLRSICYEPVYSPDHLRGKKLDGVIIDDSFSNNSKRSDILNMLYLNF